MPIVLYSRRSAIMSEFGNHRWQLSISTPHETVLREASLVYDYRIESNQLLLLSGLHIAEETISLKSIIKAGLFGWDELRVLCFDKSIKITNIGNKESGGRLLDLRDDILSSIKKNQPVEDEDLPNDRCHSQRVSAESFLKAFIGYN